MAVGSICGAFCGHLEMALSFVFPAKERVLSPLGQCKVSQGEYSEKAFLFHCKVTYMSEGLGLTLPCLHSF